jgi:hypothetical protein
MFSGVGYKFDSPLLYYATMAMFRHPIDVVHVHYPYPDSFFLQPRDQMAPQLISDVHAAVTAVLEKHHYKKVLFTGKSIGTIPIVCDFMKDDRFSDAKIILLTPLIKDEPLFQILSGSSHHGLIAIGNQDRFYDPGKIKQLRETNFDIEVVDGGNHSLNVGNFDTDASIRALARVIKKIEAFVDDC